MKPKDGELIFPKINSCSGHRLSTLKSYCFFDKRKNIPARHSINKKTMPPFLSFFISGY